MKKTSKKLIAALTATIALNGIAFSTAAEEQPEIQWDHENIQLDTRPISEKFKAFRTHNGYHHAVKKAAAIENQNNITKKLSYSDDYTNRYIAFWDAHINPTMSYQILQGFDGQGDKQGFDYQDASTTNINRNMKHVVDCRTEILEQQTVSNDPFMQFKAVRGCAVQRTNEAHDAYELERTKFARYFLGHTTPLKAQIDHFNATNEHDPVNKAIRAYSDQLSAKDYTSSMYYTSYITMFHAALNPEVTFDSFRSLPNDRGESPEFEMANPSEKIIDNNMQAFFECRDQLLPTEAPSDIETRHQLVMDILDCSYEGTMQDHKEQQALQADRAQYFMGLNASLSDQIKYFNATDSDNSWNNAVRNHANKMRNDDTTAVMYYTSYITLWHTAINPDISFDQISQTKDDAEGSDREFYWDLVGTDVIDNNFQSIMACRDELVTKPVSKDLKTRHELAESVINCAADKTKVTYDNFIASLAYVDGDTRPANDRLNLYNNNEQYKKAVQKGLAGSKNIASMTIDAHIAFMDTFITPTLGFQHLAGFTDNDDSGKEFHRSMIDSKYIDNNVDFVLECRDKILPETVPNTAPERQALMQEVYSCASELTQKQYQKYEEDVATIKADPAYGSDTNYNQWLWAEQAMTDTTITAEKLQEAGLVAETSYSSNLTENFNLILECRDATNGTPDHETVKSCAVDKAILGKSEDVRSIFKIVGGIIGGGALLGGGLVGANAYRRKKEAKKQRSRALAN